MVERPKKNPLSESILADSSEQGTDGVAALPTRLDRYGRAHQRALHMSNYAAERGESQLAQKLQHCGHWLVFRHYYTVDKVRLHAADFCKKHLLCPLCAIRRGAKYLKAYMDKLAVVMGEHPGLKAYMVTVTVKDGADLGERFAHLRKAMKAMTQARRDHLKAPSKNRHVEFAKALGGVHSVEAKRGANSGLWHPHAHMVWLCYEEPNQDKLAQEWQGWTGDSFIVDVRPFHDQDEQYVLKLSKVHIKDGVEANPKYRPRVYLDDGKGNFTDITTSRLVANGSKGDVAYRVIENSFGVFAHLDAVRLTEFIEYKKGGAANPFGGWVVAVEGENQEATQARAYREAEKKEEKPAQNSANNTPAPSSDSNHDLDDQDLPF